MTNDEKNNIYDLITKNKKKIVYAKTVDKKNFNLKKFLIDNNIIINDLDINTITIEKIVEYLTSNWNKKCEIRDCCNDKKTYGLLPRRNSTDISKFCSSDCDFKYKSQRQQGKNNTCHKMTFDSKQSMKDKNSIKMKEHIKNGTWTPNITNSWAGSKIKLKINEKIQHYRSSWEAFFHLCNQELEYEKTRIQYIFNNKTYNYITDFTDNKNKIIYEVKPDNLKIKDKNLAKFQYAKNWCKINGYKFIIITNSWFKENYNKLNYLLENQEDKNILQKRLKQFNNEN